jgi:hypothetical protein
MPDTLSSLGENDRSQLQSFADVISRATGRCDSRSALAELTGLSEQNLRRWGDQGQWPGLEALYVTRRDWPLPMLIDFLTWFAAGTRVRLHVEPIEGQPPPGTLSACCRKVTDQAIQLERFVDEAERDGRIDTAESSNIQRLTSEQMVSLQQLAHSVFVGSTAHLGRRRA